MGDGDVMRLGVEGGVDVVELLVVKMVLMLMLRLMLMLLIVLVLVLVLIWGM